MCAMKVDPSLHRVLKNGETVLERCAYAPGFAFRSRGLLGREGLGEGEGILLMPCNSIHMFGMKFAIDAVFLDKTGRVRHVCHDIAPWRVSRMVLSAKMVIEARAGWAAAAGIGKGDELIFDPQPG